MSSRQSLMLALLTHQRLYKLWWLFLNSTAHQFQFPGGETVKLVYLPDDWQELWDQHHLRLEQLLKALFTAQKAQEIPPGQPFGRYAETYRLFYLNAVSPKKTPIRSINFNQGQDNEPARYIRRGTPIAVVKGIAMDIRTIGESDVFKSGFTSSILATAGTNGKKGPFRLPYENCECLIPILEMIPGATAYNSDLVTLQQKVSSRPGLWLTAPATSTPAAASPFLS